MEIGKIDNSRALLFQKLIQNGHKLDYGYDTSKKGSLGTFTISDIEKWLEKPTDNESKLRSASRYLYYSSLQYQKICRYFPDMAIVSPYLVPLDVEGGDLLNGYKEASKLLDSMHLQHEFKRVLENLFIDGVFYGLVYQTDKGMFIKRLAPDYCIISYISDGNYGFKFDMSYFDSDKTGSLLKSYTEICKDFKKMYSTYQKDKRNQKYQDVPIESSICIKINHDDTSTIPPFVSLFRDIADVNDYKKLNLLSAEEDVTQMIGLEIPISNKGEKEDDFLLNPDTILEYYEFLASRLPNTATAFLSPFTITEVGTNAKTASDRDEVRKGIQTVYDSVGISPLVFSYSENSSGLKYSIANDESFLFSVYRNLERWLDSYIRRLTSDAFSAKLVNTTVFNIKDKMTELKELATLGLPVKLQLATVASVSPLEAMTMSELEKQLDLTTMWQPLSTSYTQSGTGEQGAPLKEETELTEAGVQQRENEDNAKRESGKN